MNIIRKFVIKSRTTFKKKDIISKKSCRAIAKFLKEFRKAIKKNRKISNEIL